MPIPALIAVFFLLTTGVTWLLFINSLKQSAATSTQQWAWPVAGILLLWLGAQAALTLHGVYLPNVHAFPPRLLPMGIFPVLVVIVMLFVLPNGRKFIGSLPLEQLIWIHAVRLPVEMVLFWLAAYKVVPELMTFEGRNWDILSGITAPLVVFFAFRQLRLSKKGLLLWNLLCLGLLMNIVYYALFSAPSAIQKFAFDQPNVAISYFPFSWLPLFVVPVVLFSHLSSIYILLSQPRR